MTKKVKISFLMLVWSIVAVQMYVNYNQKVNDTVTAFSVARDSVSEEIIKGYGFFENTSLSPKMKQKMLENIALKLGITGGYTFTEGEGDGFEKMMLTKEGKHAVTKLTIVTLRDEETAESEEQYIAIDIKTNESVEKAFNLYQRIKKVYKEVGVKAQVSLEINAEKRGNYISDDGKTVIEDVMNMTKAKEVDSIMEDGICTVYGYTGKEEGYLKLNGKKVNIQVVMTYDEEKDKTYIKIGLPIVNSSY